VGLGGRLSVGSGRWPFAPLDELRDAAAAFTTELRVALTAELALSRFPTTPTELRVALAAQLALAGLTTLAAEIRVAARAKLLLAGLPAATADLPIELRTMLRRGALAALATGLTDGEVSLVVHR